jgi:cathepsin X
MIRTLLFTTLTILVGGRMNEYIPQLNITDYVSVSENTLEMSSIPNEFTWQEQNGINYLTKNLNQHIPSYCGSCWAHGSISALSDRIKIMRKAKFPDINLSIQFLLNCQFGGSCMGGDHLATYKAIHDYGHIPFEDCMIYQACSSDSKEKACANTNDFICEPINICRTCDTFSNYGGKCVSINTYPNATISKYGAVRGADNMKNEIIENGPIACGINAAEIDEYHGGILDVPNAKKTINHIISIVGWGYDESIDKQYWIIRNSWGSYWGEMGFMRLVLGDNQLGIERSCAWAIPGEWTDINSPCNEDGSNCT